MSTSKRLTGSRMRAMERRSLVAGWVLYAVASLMPVRADDDSAAGLSTLEDLVRQWTTLRTQVSAEERNWTEQQHQWLTEIELLKKEKALLEERIGDMSVFEPTVQRDRMARLRRRGALTDLMTALGPILDRAEAQLRHWPARLPPPLAERMRPSFSRLPASSRVAENRTVGERLQGVLALYSELEGLQHSIHVTREVLTVSEGTRREMDVLYIGLARGFAVSAKGEWAGVGTPSDDGWQWTSRPEMADDVSRAVAVFHRERTAELVLLPMRVLNGDAAIAVDDGVRP